MSWLKPIRNYTCLVLLRQQGNNITNLRVHENYAYKFLDSANIPLPKDKLYSEFLTITHAMDGDLSADLGTEVFGKRADNDAWVKLHTNGSMDSDGYVAMARVLNYIHGNQKTGEGFDVDMTVVVSKNSQEQSVNAMATDIDGTISSIIDTQVESVRSGNMGYANALPILNKVDAALRFVPAIFAGAPFDVTKFGEDAGYYQLATQ